MLDKEMMSEFFLNIIIIKQIFALKINTEDFCTFPMFFINFQVSTKSFMPVIH